MAANQRTSDPTNFGITPRNGRRCTGTLAFHYIAGQSEAEDASKNRDRGAQPRPPKAGSRFLQRLRASLWPAMEWKAAVPAKRPPFRGGVISKFVGSEVRWLAANLEASALRASVRSDPGPGAAAGIWGPCPDHPTSQKIGYPQN